MVRKSSIDDCYANTDSIGLLEEKILMTEKELIKHLNAQIEALGFRSEFTSLQNLDDEIRYLNDAINNLIAATSTSKYHLALEIIEAHLSGVPGINEQQTKT